MDLTYNFRSFSDKYLKSFTMFLCRRFSGCLTIIFVLSVPLTLFVLTKYFIKHNDDRFISSDYNHNKKHYHKNNKVNIRKRISYLFINYF